MKTVSAQWIKAEAERIDQHAESSLKAWIILGQTSRYSEYKERARVLRHALTIKCIPERREYLRQNGFDA